MNKKTLRFYFYARKLFIQLYNHNIRKTLKILLSKIVLQIYISDKTWSPTFKRLIVIKYDKVIVAKKLDK